MRENKITDMKLEFDAQIAMKDLQIHSLKEEVVYYRNVFCGYYVATKVFIYDIDRKRERKSDNFLVIRSDIVIIYHKL